MRFTPKTYKRPATEEGTWEGEDRRPRDQRGHPPVVPKFTHAGERIRPLPRPYRRSSCTWVEGIGWVFNPSNRGLDGYGRFR